MGAGPPDLVDSARLALEVAVLERDYALGDMPRLRDLLAAAEGTLHASFAFAKTASGGAGAHVEVRAAPQLVCQRCLQGFSLAVNSSSDVEFTEDPDGSGSVSDRELFPTHAGGMVSLRDLAEEEPLLALPIAPACSTPQACGNGQSAPGGEDAQDAQTMRRPFGVLQDLLKKT